MGLSMQREVFWREADLTGRNLILDDQGRGKVLVGGPPPAHEKNSAPCLGNTSPLAGKKSYDVNNFK